MTSVILVVASATVSAIVVRASRDFAVRRALLDRPNERSSHSVPKPRLGGIGVILPVLGVGGGLIATGRAPAGLLVPLSAVGFIAILGLVDDLRPLPTWVRFGVQLLLASSVVVGMWDHLPAAAGMAGTWFPVPILAILAVLWIVWLTNLYNFMDGIDGLAATQALIAALGIAAVGAGSGSETTVLVCLTLGGSTIGFLLFNFPPSSIFMGDVGATAIGFFFAVVPLLPEARPVSVEPVALALSLFVLDATFTLIRRVVAGEKWYAPHRTHLYQRPVVKGVRHRTVLFIAAGAMVVTSGCAMAWSTAATWGRVALVSLPFLLFAAGHIAVGRLERDLASGS